LVACKGDGRFKEFWAMDQMTNRERLLASARGQAVDRLPFFHYWRHCQFGWAERECRNRGMALNCIRKPYTTRLHGVEVGEQSAKVDGRSVIRRTYSTPVGSVYEDEWREPGVGQWKGNRSWRGVSPWLSARIIKEPRDYEVATYIVEHTEYVADYFPLEQAAEWLGDDGIVLDHLPRSPLQTLLVDWIGSEGGRCFYHLADYPELVEGLAGALAKARQPLYEIAAHSPAPIAMFGENIDGMLLSPSLFAKYCLPEYEKQAAVLHPAGKLMAFHLDGRLASLKELIGQTPIDIVEAFHPPPMGDLSLADALAAWPEKTIWLGFPGSAYVLGPRAVREQALEILRQAGTGDRLVVAMSTENLVANENLLALTAVLEGATLPLNAATIEPISKRTAAV
jgi:hypothetical protein